MTTDTSSPAYLWARRQEKLAIVPEIQQLRGENKKLSFTISAMIQWLEQNQPDVFSRGLWDAIIFPKEYK